MTHSILNPDTRAVLTGPDFDDARLAERLETTEKANERRQPAGGNASVMHQIGRFRDDVAD